MLKTRLLQAVCTVAMLAAVPAFAQSNTRGRAPPGADADRADNTRVRQRRRTATPRIIRQGLIGLARCIPEDPLHPRTPRSIG